MSTRSRPSLLVLGLAERHGGRQATFDRTIPPETMHGAVADDLIVVSE